eukprot:Protomagalhaensia_sp_Gyna_25__438@NODE_1206_length_2068_cov_1654_042385_g960_i0_p2_GENE_NODE_1206_length_2068_cov_1654_042385_g960_i0NODE_1206_length_2068_cov_1654_042385_g960_i0_p2_ORF_typecomplete_len177_score37_15Ribosomal_L13e/PF01294_18/2_9e41_NODE_1206_length_2068_cov_1654_042385_g960_i013581888
MVKHNNAIPNIHYHKDWQRHVRTWFNQPIKRRARAQRRREKIAKNGMTPIDRLRPIVHCCSQKYNFKVRAGRGFSLEELKACGLHPRMAPTIGVAVDKRRKNRSEEGLKQNVDRLKAYLARLVVLPRNGVARKGKLGAPADSLAKDLEGKKFVKSIAEAFPIKNDRTVLMNPPTMA